MRIQILVKTEPNGGLVTPLDFCGLTIVETGMYRVIIGGVEHCVWVISDHWVDDWVDELKEVELKEVDANWEKITAKLGQEFQASVMTLDDQLKSEKKAVQALRNQLTESQQQVAALVGLAQSNADDMKFVENELKTRHRLQVIEMLEMTTELLRTV